MPPSRIRGVGLEAHLVELVGVRLGHLVGGIVVVAPDRDLRAVHAGVLQHLARLGEVRRLVRVAPRAVLHVERLVVAGHAGRQERAARSHLAGEQPCEGRLVEADVHRVADLLLVERSLARVHEHVVGRRGRELLVAIGVLRLDLRLDVGRGRILHVVERSRDHVLGLTLRVLHDLDRDLVEVALRDARQVEELVLLEHELAVRHRLGRPCRRPRPEAGPWSGS